ncbi:MAG: FixH family protein [Ignavibacteriaceae bacterium]|nr:FixH family protein [Ignavibacteriaceae bacterium]
MAKKISWGTGIVIAIIIFFILNGIVLYIAFSNKVDLETTNYYEKSLVYQEEIEKEKNALQMPLKLVQADRVFDITFPESILYESVTGKIHFYRPSDSEMDKYYKVSPDSSGKQYLSLEGFRNGLWRVVINWSYEGKDYLEKKDIFLN